MEVEDETESRRKLDEQKKKLQKEIREVDRLSFVSKELQETIKESVQHHLQEVEKRRHDLMPEHQKVRGHKGYKASRTRGKMQKENTAAKKEMW